MRIGKVKVAEKIGGEVQEMLHIGKKKAGLVLRDLGNRNDCDK